MPRELFYSVGSSDSSLVFYDKSTNTIETLVPTREKTSTVIENSNYKKSFYLKLKIVFIYVLKWLLHYSYRLYQIQFRCLMKIYILSIRAVLLDIRILKRCWQGSKTKKLLILVVFPFLLLGAWWVLMNTNLPETKINSTIASYSYTKSTDSLSNKIFGNLSESIQKNDSQDIFEEKLTENIPKVDLNDNQLKYVIKEITQSLKSDIIAEKILESSNFRNILIPKLENLEFSKYEKKINDLTKEVSLLKLHILDLQKSYDSKMAHALHQLEAKHSHVIDKLHQCCKAVPANIEQYVNETLYNIFTDEHYLKGTYFYKHIIKTFVPKKDVEHLLSLQDDKFNTQYTKIISELKAMSSQADIHRPSRNITSELIEPGCLSIIQVDKIVKNLFTIYDADKTGMVDYAVEIMGGQILTIRCTENHPFGKSPKTIITPTVSLGDCWAFKNFPGFVVIKLTSVIEIQAFSIEHISKLVVPNGKIDSAPKEFEVYGLTNQYDNDPVKLGEYVYDFNGEALQFFSVQNSGQIFGIIELIIHSNYGNPNYTCLYRFRVHGKSI